MGGNGARFAASHPLASSNTATTAINSIEGQIQQYQPSVVNDDAHLVITYIDPTTSAPCGHYSQASNSFVAVSGYVVGSNCVIPGDVIQIDVTYSYRTITPGFSGLLGSVTTARVTDRTMELS